jgi:HrpA-like RNA helicase
MRCIDKIRVRRVAAPKAAFAASLPEHSCVFTRAFLPQLAAENEELRGMLKRNRTSDKARQMRTTRQRLPAYQDRQRVIDAVSGHRVTVIAGATGCGKSTQVRTSDS